MAMWVSTLKNLRCCAVITGLSNVVVILIGAILIKLVYPDCGHKDILPFVVILLGCCIKIFIMIRTGIAQQATATMILNRPSQSAVLDAVIRHERRIRYKRWLLWTRFLMLTTVLQFLATTFLMLIVAKHVHQRGASSNCVLGHVSNGTKWQQDILVLFIIMMFYVGMVQCFTGSDILRWRSFYATEDNAWKTHYSEIFDHGIREALCCMGRVKYLNVLEDDEIYSVAQLLGDLVDYRAAGTGHLELLAGLALLQTHSESAKLYEGCLEAPEERIQEAAVFHPFAEAAYTVLVCYLILEEILYYFLVRGSIGKGFGLPGLVTGCPPLELLAWYPVLKGDNWWRGHAAAFLKYVNLSPDALRQGRVNQAKCEATYFIVVVHHLKSVVIAVRGTETPEDLITDGLCRECILSPEDLDGLIKQ
ncbi:unnamed protein product [Camellia sinensis]